MTMTLFCDMLSGNAAEVFPGKHIVFANSILSISKNLLVAYHVQSKQLDYITGIQDEDSAETEFFLGK
jgi:hypothetical protein